LIFSIISLLFVFLFFGLFLICINLEIFGIFYLIIYAGALIILFSFALLLISTNEKTKTSVFFIFLKKNKNNYECFLISISFLNLIFNYFLYSNIITNEKVSFSFFNINETINARILLNKIAWLLYVENPFLLIFAILILLFSLLIIILIIIPISNEQKIQKKIKQFSLYNRNWSKIN
jgi:NADH:ubiquinone oxidoreductase subunit 6 (subunit J)